MSNPGPPFLEDEDVLFPYWEWRTLLREEWAMRERLVEQEHSHIQWIGEQLLSLAHRLLHNEESAGRCWGYRPGERVLLCPQGGEAPLHPRSVDLLITR